MVSRDITLTKVADRSWRWSVDEPAVDDDAPVLRDDEVWRYDTTRRPATHLGHGHAPYPDIALRQALLFIRYRVEGSEESSFLKPSDIPPTSPVPWDD